jgi:hypothetical protein
LSFKKLYTTTMTRIRPWHDACAHSLNREVLV